MTNTEIAQVFLRIAEIMAYRDESAFKVRAYYRAALVLSGLSEPIADLAAKQALEAVPGVGEAISGKIGEILTTGTCALYERLKSETPLPVRELLRVPGLTPRLVRLLETQCGVSGPTEFQALAGSDRLFQYEALGLKVEDAGQILRAVEAANLWPAKPSP